MTRFIRWTLFAFVVVASIWTAKPAKAQDTSKNKTPSSVKSEPVLTSSDSVTIAEKMKTRLSFFIAVTPTLTETRGSVRTLVPRSRTFDTRPAGNGCN